MPEIASHFEVFEGDLWPSQAETTILIVIIAFNGFCNFVSALAVRMLFVRPELACERQAAPKKWTLDVVWWAEAATS